MKKEISEIMTFCVHRRAAFTFDEWQRCRQWDDGRLKLLISMTVFNVFEKTLYCFDVNRKETFEQTEVYSGVLSKLYSINEVYCPICPTSHLRCRCQMMLGLTL